MHNLGIVSTMHWPMEVIVWAAAHLWKESKSTVVRHPWKSSSLTSSTSILSIQEISLPLGWLVSHGEREYKSSSQKSWEERPFGLEGIFRKQLATLYNMAGEKWQRYCCLHYPPYLILTPLKIFQRYCESVTKVSSNFHLGEQLFTTHTLLCFKSLFQSYVIPSSLKIHV